MDELREELTTLGQRILYAEVLRDDAIARVATLWREHGRHLAVEDVGRWTTLSREVLDTLDPGAGRNPSCDEQ
jgi:hypothetical protein